MEVVESLVTGFCVIVMICFGLIAFSGVLRKKFESNDSFDQLRSEIEAKNAETRKKNEDYYINVIESMLEKIYNDLCIKWNKPKDTLTVDIFSMKSDLELKEMQSKLPYEWFNFFKTCDCWVYNDIFYLLENKQNLIKEAKSSPNYYNEENKIYKNMVNIQIPLKDIHYFKSVGELMKSERVIMDQEIEYTGMSINGIGFGEIKHTPGITVPDIIDTRCIVLYFKVDDKNELQCLYFGIDCLDTFIRVLPQFEK